MKKKANRHSTLRMTTVEVFAPAKINLALHVTGKREDGYHALDTLVAFADVGDRLTLEGVAEIAQRPAPTRLEISGPEGHGLDDDGHNLVARAIDMMVNDVAPRARLEKHLPVSSGIGGGSADAAAAMRGVARTWNMTLSDSETLSRLSKAALALGADVPMCLISKPLRAEGIGEKIALQDLPPLHAVLVNPRVPVSTPDVFGALATPDGTPLSWPPPNGSVRELCAWLRQARNDLETPAQRVAPIIGDVLGALSQQSGLLLSRMSGSGATCFGIFTDVGLAEIAAKIIAQAEPDWWVRDVLLGDMADLARPCIA